MFWSISFLFKTISGLFLTTLIIGSLALNLTMFLWSTGALAVSTAFSTLTGVTSVVGGLADANDILQKKNKKLAAKQAKSAANKKLIGDLSEKIARRTNRNAARNIISMPAESLPWIGLTTVLGVTALEIYDACATMQDMKEINQILGTSAAVDVDTTCGMEVPTREDVIASIEKSPQAAYEAVTSIDVTIPSWSEVTNSTINTWDGSVKGAANAWDWLLSD